MGKKKTNPRRIPVTMADLNKAVAEAKKQAAKFTAAIIFTALTDKKNFSVDDLKDLWKQVAKLSVEITEGRISITDLIYTLKEDYEIGLEE